MNAFASLHHQKFKSWSAIAGLHGHVDRTIPCPNADPSLSHNNQNLLELPEEELGLPWETITRLRIGDQTIRKNAVLTCGLILNVSPQYFRPDNPDQPYTYDSKRVEQWATVCREWLIEKYGKNRLISISLHLDETTPHIHAVYIPFDETGKLNARGFIGANRSAMSDLQTDYAHAIAHLGIARGQKHGKANYEDIKKAYPKMKRLADLSEFEAELAAQKLQQERDKADLEKLKAEIERQKAELEALSHQFQQQKQKNWAQNISQWAMLLIAETRKTHLRSQSGNYEFTFDSENQFLVVKFKGVAIATKQGKNPAEPTTYLEENHYLEVGELYNSYLKGKIKQQAELGR